MKTLREHNEERARYYQKMEEASRPHPNGIACPMCEEELWDSSPRLTLTSKPPRKKVHCPNCGYTGSALK